MYLPPGSVCLCPLPGPPPYLFAILADVGVDLIEGTQHIELHSVQTGLLSQVGVHVLVTDGRELGDVCVVSAVERTGSLVRTRHPFSSKTLTSGSLRAPDVPSCSCLPISLLMCLPLAPCLKLRLRPGDWRSLGQTPSSWELPPCGPPPPPGTLKSPDSDQILTGLLVFQSQLYYLPAV